MNTKQFKEIAEFLDVSFSTVESVYLTYPKMVKSIYEWMKTRHAN